MKSIRELQREVITGRHVTAVGFDAREGSFFQFDDGAEFEVAFLDVAEELARLSCEESTEHAGDKSKTLDFAGIMCALT